MRILLQRRAAGLTQAQLAEALGITFQQVQKYERGDNRISASTLVRAAGALNTTVASLVGEDDPAETPPEVLHALTTLGALELLAAYAGLEREDDRGLVLRLAQALGREGPDWTGLDRGDQGD